MNSMQQRQQTQSRQRLFTASEVAQFEYCPLVWWHEQFEPLAQAGNEELFARMVELEYEHGAQATALPEYKMIEQQSTWASAHSGCIDNSITMLIPGSGHCSDYLTLNVSYARFHCCYATTYEEEA